MNKTILWLSSITFPEALSILRNEQTLFKSSGGWIVALAETLTNASNTLLIVVSVDSSVSCCKELQGQNVLYILLPQGKRDGYYEEQLCRIKKQYVPDVIHIHGTEHKLGLHYIKACGSKGVVVSLQGVVSEIAKHYTDGLSIWQIVRNITVRDLVKGTIFTEKRRFNRKGNVEKAILKNIEVALGRTTFDKSFALAINPDIHYYHCGEILRPPFYEGQWAYEKCRKHSIFLSQSYYPVKGLHFVLQALPSVLRKYPDLEVRVAGFDFTYYNARGLQGLKRSGYGNIIKKYIKELELQKYITFLGNLDANEMKAEFLRANIFICSSTCENSPNSLCEAQIMGTPSIASYVGGVPDTFVGERKYLYQHDNINELSYKIISLFGEENLNTPIYIDNLRKRHCADTIASNLLEIYRKI